MSKPVDPTLTRLPSWQLKANCVGTTRFVAVVALSVERIYSWVYTAPPDGPSGAASSIHPCLAAAPNEVRKYGLRLEWCRSKTVGASLSGAASATVPVATPWQLAETATALLLSLHPTQPELAYRIRCKCQLQVDHAAARDVPAGGVVCTSCRSFKRPCNSRPPVSECVFTSCFYCQSEGHVGSGAPACTSPRRCGSHCRPYLPPIRVAGTYGCAGPGDSEGGSGRALTGVGLDCCSGENGALVQGLINAFLRPRLRACKTLQNIFPVVGGRYSTQ